MGLAAAAFVANDCCMKLAMADLPPFEVLMLRGISATIWCLPTLFVLGFGRKIALGLNPWVLLRAVSECVAVLIFVFMLKRMPIGDLTALMQTAPLFILLAAAVVGRETIGVWRVVLIILGFAGAVLVAQPGGATASVLAPIVLVAAIFAAARDILSRKVPANVPALVTAFVTILVVMTAAGFSTASFEAWVVPQRQHVWLMAAAGLLLMGAHFCLMLAFRLAKASTLAPFLYAFTLWAVLAGLLIFGDRPTLTAWTGISLIVACGLVVVLLDERQRRPAVAVQLMGAD